MSDTQKHTKPNVPDLRFPGFEGEWARCTLGEIGEPYIGLTYSPADVVNEGGTIVFRSSNIQNGEIDYSDIVRVNKKIKDSIITRKDDLLICARNGSPRLIGKNALLKDADAGQTFGAFMLVFRSNDNHFVHQLLSTKGYYSQVSENLGARINQITTSNIKDFEFYFPKSIAERNKIADFLNLIDERISIQNKVIEKYESLIKALAHEIIGKNAPNKTLSECVCCTSSILKESDLEEAGAVPVYGAAGISGFTDSVLYRGEDSILITKDGSGVGSLRYVRGPHSFVGTLNSMTPKECIYLPYIYYALQNVCFESYRTGQAIPHIYFKDYGKEAIYCPSYEEQVRMAIGLEKIDAKIGLEKATLQSYKSAKVYLLSAMLI